MEPPGSYRHEEKTRAERVLFHITDTSKDSRQGY